MPTLALAQLIDVLHAAIVDPAHAASWQSKKVAPPSRELVAAACSAAFWASTMPNEGRAASCVLQLRPRHDEELRFGVPAPLNDVELSRLAPVVNDADVDLAAWGADAGSIWGLVPASANAPSIAVLGPAHLVGRAFGKVFVVERQSFHALLAGGGPEDVFARVLGDDARSRRAWAMAELTLRIRADAHGGWFAVAPREVSLDPIFGGRTEVDDRQGSDALSHLLPDARSDDDGVERLRRAAAVRFERHCAQLARLARVDGAVVIDADTNVRAFGGFVKSTGVDDARVVEVLPDGERRTVAVRDLGGGRHRAAAAVVLQDPRIASVVVSEDGPVTLFSVEDGALTARRRLEWRLHRVARR